MRILLSIIALLSTLNSVTAQSKLNKLNLSGKVIGQQSGTIYLQRYENKSFTTIDSTKIINGSFTFHSKVLLPEIYGLSLVGTALNPFDSFIILLDDQPIQVSFNSKDDFKNTVVTGSKEQDLLATLLKQRGVSVNDIIKTNPKSLAVLYYLYRYQSYRLSPSELNDAINLLDPSFKKIEYVRVLKELAGTLEGVVVGNKAPDFNSILRTGENVKLSDYLGNSYVLIDFWASWCPPCRAENPHLVEVYKKYKDKGFEVIGISLDKKEDPWLKAIQQDGLPWEQFIDPKAWAGEGVVKYGVRLIPSNFLIDKNGNIVAKNLKGDALDRELELLLGNK